MCHCRLILYLYMSTYVLPTKISFTNTANCSFIFTLFGNRLINESASTFNYRDSLISIFIFGGVRIIRDTVIRAWEPVDLSHKMGNSKSKKVKISDEQTQNVTKNNEETRERINSLKTDVSDAGYKNVNDGFDNGESKDKDNASSASTVEVLDDK
uniref:Uncharacterized protein n=1 Tax=Heliothis virescens TaxID=7102 RepID=A0A2A4JL33_HELVI